MPKYAYDGVIRLWYVAALDDEAAPALTELSAGTELTPYLRALDTPFEGSTVEAGTADSDFNSTVSGTYGGQPVTGTFTRDKVYADDDAWTTLGFGVTGYWIVAWRGGTGAANAMQVGDRVDVIPIDVMSRNPVPYGRNVLASLNVQCSVPDVPGFDIALTAT